MKVYAAINAVQRELAKTGITKDRTASTGGQGSYKFRGIDDVYNVISPLLGEHGLCILPRMVERNVVERESSNGKALFYVTVTAEFDFVSAEDGSKHTVRTYGEAMDSGDKATNKAMSAAYKYAAFQAFAIPTEGDNDADATTHQVQAKPKNERPKLTPDREKIVRKTADQCIALHAKGDEWGVYGAWQSLDDNDEKLVLWDMLHDYSEIRSLIRAKKTDDENERKLKAAA